MVNFSAYERFDQGEEALLALLESSDVPVVLAVTVPDAPSCRTASDVLQQASKNIEGRARIVHVDAAQCPKLLRQHQVGTVPALLALDNGGLVAQHVGVLEPGDVIHVLGLDIWREAETETGGIAGLR